ncbi:glycosyltransferase family 4 protein [Candidatus Auribacterota bacterium]
MPLLLISMDFPPHKDGITTLSEQLAVRLHNNTDPFYVIGPSARGDKEYDSKQPFKIYRSPLYDYGYLKLLPLLFIVPYVVYKHNIDKIIATNIGYGGLLAWVLQKFKKLDYIVTAQGYEFQKFVNNRIIKSVYTRIYRNAKAIISCSNYVKKKLVDFGVADNIILTVYPAVDTGRFKPKDVPADFINKYALKDKRIILSVSRLISRKGHDKVIEALPVIKKECPDILYIIIGKGPQKDHLEELARRNDVAGNIFFAGEIPDDDLVMFYNLCDLFVMPSRETENDGHIEGFGIVFIEANACRKPVVGGRSGGVPEAVIDGKTGLLANPLDPSDIADKIIRILKDRKYARELADNGYSFVRDRFSWDFYADRFKNIIYSPKRYT